MSKKNEVGQVKRLRLTWVKSSIGYTKRQKGTVKALGFRKLGDIVEHDDTLAIRGMADKVSHLVRLEVID